MDDMGEACRRSEYAVPFSLGLEVKAQHPGFVKLKAHGCFWKEDDDEGELADIVPAPSLKAATENRNARLFGCYGGYVGSLSHDY